MVHRILQIVKRDNRFVVDEPKAPGSPPIGQGRTMKEAIGDWVVNNQDKIDIGFDTLQIQATIALQRQRALRQR